MENKIDFDAKGFIDYLVFVKGNFNDLPQVTVADLEAYSRYSFAQSMSTPVMPVTRWEDKGLLITSNGSEEVAYSIEMVFNRLEYAVEVINTAIALDNTDPEMRVVSGGNVFDEDLDEPTRFYDRLKNSVYKQLVAEEVYMTFSATIKDVIAIEYGKDFIDPAAVESALADTPATIVSEITGIPKNTVIKYQRPVGDPNHRVWISDNALALGRWVSARKYGDHHDSHLQ